MNKIMIKNLKLRCIIGVKPQERRKKQEVVINVEVSLDFSGATKHDDLAGTVNYEALHKKIVSFVEGSKFKLIERLADRIADLCLEEKMVKRVKVTVEKPGALKFADSPGVEIIKEN